MKRISQPLHIVLLGVTDYGGAPELPSLPSVANNVRDFSAALKSNKESAWSISKLRADSTKTTVLRRLREVDNSGVHLAVFYFAGHGMIHQEKSELVLMLNESTIDFKESNGLLFNEVAAVFRRIRVPRKIAILDCCFSGVAAQLMGNPKNHHEWPDHNPWLPALESPSGSAIFAATGPDQTAFAPLDREHTAFTGSLIAGLHSQELAQEGGPTLLDLFEWVRSDARSKGLPEPTLTGNAQILSEPFFARNYRQTSSRREEGVASEVLESQENQSQGQDVNLPNKSQRMEARRKRGCPRVIIVKSLIRYPIKDQDFGVPLGPWTLKSYLEERDFEVEVFDERLEGKRRRDPMDFKESVADYDVVGVSASTCEVPEALEKLAWAKSQGKTTIIGGIFATSNEEYLLSHPQVDYVIPGVAAKPLKNLLEKISRAGYDRHHNVSGVATSVDGKISYLPARDGAHLSIDKRRLREIVARYGDYLGGKIDIVTARGCPFSCEFCSIQKETKKSYYTRNDNDVINEVLFLATNGFSKISIKDEIFPIDRDRSVSLLRRINARLLSRGLTVEYKIKSRVNIIREKKGLLEELYELNVREIQFGVEAIERPLHTFVHKGSIPEGDPLRDFLNRVADMGIVVNASFILGIESETPEYYVKLRQFVQELSRPEFYKIYLNFYTPHPWDNRWNMPPGSRLVNNDLRCFTHKIPLVCPRSLEYKRYREEMLRTYDDLVDLSGSSLYNPVLSSDHRETFIDAVHDYSRKDLPVFRV